MFSTSGNFMTSEISGNLQIIFAYVSEAVSYIENCSTTLFDEA